MLSNVGTRLREWRDSAGLSRHALAHRSGISTAQIARIELYGATPKIATARQLAKSLDRDFMDLVTG